MGIAMQFNKLVVGDVPAAERFYLAMGLKVASRNTGGEGNVRQEQSWLSASGDMTTHVLILTRFLELPPPPRPVYPGEGWLVFNVDDVDAICRAAEANGGSVFRAGDHGRAYAVLGPVLAGAEH